MKKQFVLSIAAALLLGAPAFAQQSEPIQVQVESKNIYVEGKTQQEVEAEINSRKIGGADRRAPLVAPFQASDSARMLWNYNGMPSSWAYGF